LVDSSFSGLSLRMYKSFDCGRVWFSDEVGQTFSLLQCNEIGNGFGFTKVKESYSKT